MAAFSVHTEVIAEVDHDALNLLPVYSETAIVHEGSPKIRVAVAAEVVNTRPSVWVDLSDEQRIAWAVLTSRIAECFRRRLDFETVIDMKLSTELAEMIRACRLV